MAAKNPSQRQNVQVVCRIRPTNQKEISNGGITCIKYTNTTIEATADGNINNFSFDHIFGPESTQVEVFQDTARHLIGDVLSGYNATIFAYGQTGTGKTHTMEGVITSDDTKGIIPRAVEALFDGVSEADENIEFTFKVSYVEIYLEKIRDLLDETRLKNNLTIREDKLKGVYIAGVTEEYVTSVDELLNIMRFGAMNRAVAATGMNEGSSRSHSVFTITVGQRDVISNSMKSGKLVLVDLAGSEMVRKTNASGQQLEEAKMINKSLSALGQVINALTDEKATHIPYRDSKLTRILQDSLGGNSKTVLIIQISPSSFNANESVSTLRFGTRAKSIENKVVMNQTRSIEELENLLIRAEKAIDAQTAHIISLQTQLQTTQSALANATTIINSYSSNPPPPPVQISQESEVVSPPTEETKKEEKIEEIPKNYVILQEGQIIVEIQRLENEAKVLKQLEETVNQLNQELEDEKADSTQKENEVNELHLMLKEKDRLIKEATVFLQDSQNTTNSIKERYESILKDKILLENEIQSMRTNVEEDKSKIQFQVKELEVRLNTLESENSSLKKEISELSGDVELPSHNNKKKNIINTGLEDEDSLPSPTPSQQSRRSSVRRSSLTPSESNEEISKDNTDFSNPSARKEMLTRYDEEFQESCQRFNIHNNISQELLAIMQSYAIHVERNVLNIEEKYHANEKLLLKRIRDLEDQRNRLEHDIKHRFEHLTHLQMKLDSMNRLDPKTLNETLNERERSRQRSLQQRLEQLVAVHRQLLRKFGALERDNDEAKKKILIRDERIKQLEGSSKTMIGSLRQQAEKHMIEITNFREQIQLMKNEYEQKVDQLMKNTDGGNLSLLSPGKNVRGGNQPKSLRGGGGAYRSFYQSETSKSYYDSHNKSVHDLFTDLPEPDLFTSSNSKKPEVSFREEIEEFDENDNNELMTSTPFKNRISKS